MYSLKLLLKIFGAVFTAVAVWLGTVAGADVGRADPEHWGANRQEPVGNILTVSILDVGHGDATLLQYAGKNILIDTGDSRQRTALVRQLEERGVKRIETMILTHHDADHIGNAVFAAGKYGVSRILDNGLINERNSSSRKLSSMLNQGYKNKKLRAGDMLEVGDNVKLEVLSPGDFLPQETRNDHNNNSIVLRLRYGNFSMLFCGDIEAPAEAALAARYGPALKADVLKVAHHGSKSSSYYKFIEAVRPRYALISCGAFEEYRHPNKKVVSSLEHLGAEVLTTYSSGALVVISDGKTYQVKEQNKP